MDPLASYMGLGAGEESILQAEAQKRGEKALRDMCAKQGGDKASCDALVDLGEALSQGDIEAAKRAYLEGGVMVMCNAVGGPVAAYACRFGWNLTKNLIESWKSPDIDPTRWRIGLDGRMWSGSVSRRAKADPTANLARETVPVRSCFRKEDVRPGEIWVPTLYGEPLNECWPLQVFFPDLGTTRFIKAAQLHPVWQGFYARDWDGIARPVGTDPLRPPDSPPQLHPGTIYLGPGWIDMLAMLPGTNIRSKYIVASLPGTRTVLEAPEGSVAVFDPSIGKYRILAPT